MDEIGQNVVTVGDFKAYSKDSPTDEMRLFVKVTSPTNKVLYLEKDISTGRFAFTTSESGDYKACFTAKDAKAASNTKIRLDWKTGVAATNWGDIAKKQNLDEMTVELRRLEDTVKEIHDEMLDLRKREEEMRDLNEATNERVAFYSITSLLVCVGLGAWQLWHLRRFFHRKKLL